MTTMSHLPGAPKSARELNKQLGYEFKNLRTLELACIHKSFGNEFRADVSIDARDNERLEFLGDAILDLSVSQILLERYPDSTEGDLSKLRAGLVNERMLARIARDIGLGEYIWLGKGEEQTGGRDKDSILASTFEALIAAVFLDGGFPAADIFTRAMFSSRLLDAQLSEGLQDFKTELQEVVQAKFKSAPRYTVVKSEGPDHDKTFHVELTINNKTAANASGKSKKDAEQSAAKIALQELLKK